MYKKSQHEKRVVELWEPIRYNAFRIVNSVTKDEALTEDVLQEALIIAFKKFHTLRDEEKFASWFYKIAIRIANKLLTKNRKLVLIDEVHETVEKEQQYTFLVDETLLHIENKDTVFRILMKLPQRERHLFHMRYVQDMTISEISTMMGMKEGTLKSIFYRACKKLYDSLNEEYGYGQKN